jgi:hypothetical protein
MRRCSFSSSVLARLRGGRLVLGSGSTCPHDLRFLTDLESPFADEGAGDDCEDVGESKGTWRSSILMVVVAAVSEGGGVMS